jgi:hypothetical protein
MTADKNRLRSADDDIFAFEPEEFPTCNRCGERDINCDCDGHGE